MQNKHVLVLFGGVSTEHMVSCRSAFNIISGLRESGHKVSSVGITKSGEWLRFLAEDKEIVSPNWDVIAREALADRRAFYQPSMSIREFIINVAGGLPDVIFPAVHGINCEDGVLQGLLEMSGIPYVGAGVLSSALCMDKASTKKLISLTGIDQCNFTISNRYDILKDLEFEVKRIEGLVSYPMFLKPSNGGSSVGTTKVVNRDELETALVEVSTFDRTVIIEEYLDARELECAVLGNLNPVASRVGEILISDTVEYYDYETKYFSDTDSEAKIPADISLELEAKIQAQAIEAFIALGVKGLARVDFFLDRKTGALYFNEVNNLPGFTSISLYPKAFEAQGILLPELVSTLCTLAIEEKLAASRKEDI